MDLETNKMNVNDLAEDMIGEEENVKEELRTNINWDILNQEIEDKLLDILFDNKNFDNRFENLHFVDIFPNEKISNNKKLKNKIKNHKDKNILKLTNDIVSYILPVMNNLINKINGAHLDILVFYESEEYNDNKELIDYIFKNYLDLSYPDKVYMTIKKNIRN